MVKGKKGKEAIRWCCCQAFLSMRLDGTVLNKSPSTPLKMSQNKVKYFYVALLEVKSEPNPAISCVHVILVFFHMHDFG